MPPSTTRHTARISPIVLTMGDPAGIGPEIIAKALSERPALLPQTVVAGDVETLRRAARQWGAGSNRLMLAEIADIADLAAVPPGCMAVVQACKLVEPVAMGCISASAGRAAADCIAWAAQAVLEGQARAVVTAPIHKEALSAAGVDHPGHTELLQSLAAAHAGVPVSALPVRMMLSCPGLSTVLVSIHVSLRQALQAVTHEQVLQTIRITHAHFRRTGVAEPRIAVAGLNPHAGEGGPTAHARQQPGTRARDDSNQGDRVVEIGPGMGALTRVLVRRYPKMTAVEIDQRSVRFLNEKLPELNVVHGDVLDFDFPAGRFSVYEGRAKGAGGSSGKGALTIEGGLMYAEVSINGVKGRALIDTGSPISIMNTEMARAAKAQRDDEKTQLLQGATGGAMPVSDAFGMKCSG